MHACDTDMHGGSLFHVGDQLVYGYKVHHMQPSARTVE